MDYSQLPIAALIGFLIFAELPGPLPVAGTGIIVLATLYIARREAMLKGAAPGAGEAAVPSGSGLAWAAPEWLARIPDNLKAMLWMLASAVLFSSMSAFVKLAALGLPLTPWLAHGGLGVLRSQRMGLLFLRAALGYLAIGTFTFALTRLALADVIAPIDFTRLPASALIGYLLFAELLSLWTVAGVAVILASTLYIARREAAPRRGRAADRS